MMYARVMAALLDAPMTILMADQSYFQSLNCVTELGASVGSRGNVFALLSPEMAWEDIPSEFNWIGWRYSHDPLVLREIRDCIDQSSDIDLSTYHKTDNYHHWEELQSDVAKQNLEIFDKSWPKLKDYRPLPFSEGRTNAVFGLSSWELEDGETIPVLYADRDQRSIMNSDRLVKHIQSKYDTEEIFALWPDEHMGVCIHTGGGGTRIHQEAKLASLGIPLLSAPSGAPLRDGKNYSTPPWLGDWEADHGDEVGRSV